jgi:hypothetical protein
MNETARRSSLIIIIERINSTYYKGSCIRSGLVIEATDVIRVVVVSIWPITFALHV